MPSPRALLLILGISLMAGCGSGSLRQSSPAVSLEEATTLQENGMFGVAAQAFENLAKRDRGQRSSLRLRAAEAWQNEGSAADVSRLVPDIQRDQLSASESARFDLLLAELAMDRDEAQTALDLLLFDQGLLPEALQPRARELRARAYFSLGDFARSASERAALSLLLPADEKRRNDSEIATTLEQLDAQTLTELLGTRDRSDPLYPYLLRSVRRGTDAPQDFTAQAVAAPTSSGDTTRFSAIPSGGFSPLCVLLPTKGAMAPAADALRDGVFSAHYSDSGKRPEIRLIDSGDSADSAVRAYDQAVAAGCAAILGPLPRTQVTAIFSRGYLNTPTLALNYADSGLLPPPGALQFALLPEEEAAAAGTRMVQNGLRNIAALVPNDDMGRRSLASLDAALRSGQATLLSSGQHVATDDKNETALGDALGYADSRRRADSVRAITGLTLVHQPIARSDIDGLFLVARPQQAEQLLKQLRAAGAGDLPTYSTSAIYANAGRGDPAVAGIYFSDSPWVLGFPVADTPPAANVSALGSSKGAAARLFAFGMDAYRIIRRMNWFEANPDSAVEGASGTLVADRSGSIRRRGSWAVLDANGIPRSQ